VNSPTSLQASLIKSGFEAGLSEPVGVCNLTVKFFGSTRFRSVVKADGHGHAYHCPLSLPTRLP